MKRLFLLALIGFAVWLYNYAKYLNFNSELTMVIKDTNSDINKTDEYADRYLEYEKKLYNPKVSTHTLSKPEFKYDGRKYCSQMHSCEEAMFFLHNCPNTKMDGGSPNQEPDGIPCEKQWCH